MTQIHVDPTSLPCSSLYSFFFFFSGMNPPTPYLTITTEENNNNIIKTTQGNRNSALPLINHMINSIYSKYHFEPLFCMLSSSLPL
ncbi:hypothetical protein ACJW30_01G110900 [Castanea mollissima]